MKYIKTFEQFVNESALNESAVNELSGKFKAKKPSKSSLPFFFQIHAREKDKDGKTVLMYTSYYNKLDVANLLIENGAYVNEKDKNGKTALMYAKSKDMISLLKEAGAI